MHSHNQGRPSKTLSSLDVSLNAHEDKQGDGQQNFHQRPPKTQSERGTVFDLISMGPVCLRIHKNVRNFANDGTVHGFYEIYASKSLSAKLFWLIILVTSFGTSFYQAMVVSKRFISKDNAATVISILGAKVSDDQIYPPVAICYCHWTSWVNYSRVLEYGLDKQTFLYSMSFISDVVALQPFKIDYARTAFLKVIAENNFSTITSYYRAIARDSPISVSGRQSELKSRYLTNQAITSYMTLRDVGMREFQMCHEYPSEAMKRLIEPEVTKVISFSIKATSYPMIDPKMIGDLEYNFYAARFLRENTFYWILNDSHSLDFTNFTVPMLLFPNSYDVQHFETMVDVLELDYFAMTATVHKTKAKDTGCIENAKIVEKNRSCEKRYPSLDDNGCVDVATLAVVDRDFVKYACRREILPLGRVPANHEFEYAFFSAQVTDIDEKTTRDEKRSKCLSQCKSYQPCERWRYKYTLDKAMIPEYSSRMSSVRTYEIFFKYLSASDILVIEKVRRKNWYLYIGNVGGIFGIWTGASMITFVQVVYFCTVHERAVHDE
uniref:Uncharacterized protein n=1 Tax=Romanomermis culicivorax TaxID=13658 RepID=A0A915L3T7_ROMCU